MGEIWEIWKDLMSDLEKNSKKGLKKLWNRWIDGMVTLKKFGSWNGMEKWIKRGLGVSEKIEIWKNQ